MNSPSYYRSVAICAKILREGTGLAVDRMTLVQLDDRTRKHLNYLRSYAVDSVVTEPRLARAIVELDDMYSEIMLRGVQLRLDIP